jgi:ribosomal protein L7/L12
MDDKEFILEVSKILAEKKRAALLDDQMSFIWTAVDILRVAKQLDKLKQVKRRGVVLESVGNNKIAAIKIIREFTYWGLKESKDAAEATPFNFFVNDAEKMVEQFKLAGAIARLCDGACETCNFRFRCYTE